ncbi:hypothetical protein BOX15_Mlig014552g2 [Macrostomum lignano]|uniref:Uncharacterized protein n=1 Tax=Macrostomum lignano TaxID=282301 RepID=A0A267F082_9PLAT|nr:hypothetical protein BOX15_Mlig014552g2 [Macrostomum lignano]
MRLTFRRRWPKPLTVGPTITKTTTLFWDSRYLESRLLPDLPLFKENKPCFQIERRTVSRLLLLISQGGLLADPELMSLHSIDSFLKGSYCVLAQEPPEAAVLLYGITNGSLPSLRFAACRPGHPFLRLLLKNFCRRALVLHGVNSSESKAQQKVTALALTAAFEAAVAAYDDTCSRRVCDHRDRIVLADASIFLPLSPSGGLRSRLLTVCQDNAAAGRGSKFELRACKQLRNPMREDGTRLVAASLAVPMTLSDREAAAARRIRLDSIGPNVGRAAVLNWLLPNAR